MAFQQRRQRRQLRVLSGCAAAMTRARLEQWQLLVEVVAVARRQLCCHGVVVEEWRRVVLHFHHQLAAAPLLAVAET